MHISKEDFKSIIVKSGIVDTTDFDIASEESSRTGQNLSDVLIGGYHVPEEYLTELLKSYWNVPIVNLKNVSTTASIIEMLPETLAKTKNVVLFEYTPPKKEESGIAKLAMLDPLDYDTIEFVRAKLGVWVEVYITSPTSLKYGLKQYKPKVEAGFEKVIAENVEKSILEAGGEEINKSAESVPIISILDHIMERAITLNASDIHFEPLPNELLVRFRIDGILQEIVRLPKMIDPLLVARVKILAKLQIDEHRTPQDGRFSFNQENGLTIDVRTNIMPVFHGEKVEMRLLKSSARPLTLSDLGFSKEMSLIMLEEIKKPHGMILVTGPTGAGKTTTLYAILQLLNTPMVNITTIEDPIEYEFPRINQTQVSQKAGITFANGLRALLRQNPDIIMVGEIRDNETVEISVHAALTGHLVLSSLHTNDAPSALPRLLDMGAEAFLLSGTVNVVIAQRLVRKICISCIESVTMSSKIKGVIENQIKTTGDTHIKDIPDTVYHGKGCKVCEMTGFQGQIAIFEVFKVTESIRELLLKRSPVAQMRKKAIDEGMITMFEDGLAKVAIGITTIEEVLRVVNE